MDKLIDDDSITIMALVSDEFKLIAVSFCLNADEIKRATENLDALVIGKKNFVEDIYSKKQYQRHYVARILRPIFIEICMARPLLFDKDISPEAIENAIMTE